MTNAACPPLIARLIDRLNTMQAAAFQAAFTNVAETIVELAAVHPVQSVACIQQLSLTAYTTWAHAASKPPYAQGIRSGVIQALTTLTVAIQPVDLGLELIGGLFNVYAATTNQEQDAVDLAVATVTRLYGAPHVEVRAATPVCSVQGQVLVIGAH